MDHPDNIVQQLFAEAMGIPHDNRVAFLETRCQGLPDFRRRVETLLGEHDGNNGAVNGSSWDSATVVPERTFRGQGLAQELFSGDID